MATVYQEQGFPTHPLYLVLPLASLYTAVDAAFYIVAGLCVRETTGRGQKIEASLFRTILSAFRQFNVDFEGMFRAPWGPTGLMPLYRPYQCKDGKWLFTGFGNPKFFTQFAIEMGHDEWLTDPLFEGAPFLIFPPRNAQVMSMLKPIYKTKSRDEWLEQTRRPGPACGAGAEHRRLHELRAGHHQRHGADGQRAQKGHRKGNGNPGNVGRGCPAG